MAVSLRRADEADRAYLSSLLAANGLPSADVAEKPACFFVAVRDGERVGGGGLEVRGSAGLLRSVVVAEAVRGEGVGSTVCDALEAEAVEAGVETLYVLTTTAESFFADRGYEAVPRADAPGALRETAEFAELCPSAATCMRKSLADAG